MHLSNQSLLRSQAFINGKWVGAENNRTFPVTNPFDGALITHVPDMGRVAAERAILAAEKAFAPWRSENKVIHLANNTPYGLAAYFYGRDYARISRVAEALEDGMVGINTT